MKKSFLKRILGFGLAVLATVSMTACGGKKPSDSNKEDPNKTNIHVFDYKAGYSDRWLTNLEAAFSKAYANVSFEEGKTGVNFINITDMTTFNPAQITESEHDIFFFENENYYKFVNAGVFADISDIVNGKATDSESKTILEKLDDQQIDYYGAKSGDNTNYYALPSYYGNYGIIYDIDLFNERGFYIADNQDDGVIIGSNKGAKKSAGPDGEYGTPDDGLPATYDEFFALCDEIYNNDVTPVCWPGKYRTHHLGNLMDNLISDYEGVEQMRLNYTFNGEATDLVVLDADGKVTFNEDGTLKTESKTITTANGYEVGRQAGKYYAMNFIDRLISNSQYYTKESFSNTFTHTDNQQLYLYSNSDLQKNVNPIAMLIDGPWWQEEANNHFETMAKKNSKYSRTNRNFGWMPLPKATSDKVGSKNVYSDYLNAFVSIKAGLSDGLTRACKEFLRFSASDEMLKDFTLTTGAVKAYKYDMGSDLNKLSPFSKGLVSYIQDSDVVYKFSSSSFYNSNSSNLQYDVVYSAKVGGNLYKNAVDGINEGKASGTSYFEAFNKYFKAYSFWK